MLDNLEENEVKVIVKSAFDNDNVTILDFDIKNASEEKLGLFGDHFKLIVNAEIENEKKNISFFVKTAPLNEVQYEYVIRSGAFKKEILAYQTLFHDMEATLNLRETTIWHPKYYYAQNYTIVMEDLSCKGFTLSSKSEFDLDHMKITFKTLAAMHGQSLVYEEMVKEKITSTEKSFEDKAMSKIRDLFPLVAREIPYSDDEDCYMFKKYFVQTIPIIADTISDLLEGYTLHQREIIRKKIPELVQSTISEFTSCSTEYNVINQGDAWKNNIMFRYEKGVPVEGRLVDFQLSRYCPLACEVMEAYYLNTGRTFREKKEKECLAFYYEELRSEVKKCGYDLEKMMTQISFFKSCENFRRIGLVRGVILLTVVLTPPEILKKVSASNEVYEKFIFEERGKYLKECFQYKDYRERISGHFNEMIERHIKF